MVKRILVALSGTPFTDSAIKHALELAKIHQAELTGVTDVDLSRIADVGPVPIGGGAAATGLTEHRLQITQEHIEKAISDFEQSCANAGMKYCIDRETGDPFEHLSDQWRYHDLTIAGLRGLFEYGVVHSPDDEIIRLISKGIRPILAVAKEYRPIKKALITYNGSMESAKAMKRFVQMRLWPDVQIQIVCFDKQADEAEKLLSEAKSYCSAHGLDAITERVEGSPRVVILDFAKQIQADLIVLGSSSRARLLKQLLGDTVLHCLRNADIPLFLSQ
ncbi:MAG: universal stress protein [Planctomycetes bacterium]|nr:universal stress protein [Planctomycetota bacterium]